VPQCPPAAFRRSPRHRVVEIPEKRTCLTHLADLEKRETGARAISGLNGTPHARFFGKDGE
jgi:hypothetical protein